MPTDLLNNICLDTANTEDLTIFLRDSFETIPEKQRISALETILNRTDDQITSNILSFMLLDYKNYMTNELLEKLLTHPKNNISVCEQLLLYPSNIDVKMLRKITKPNITPSAMRQMLRSSKHDLYCGNKDIRGNKEICKILRNKYYSDAPINAKLALLKELSCMSKPIFNDKINQIADQLSKIQSELQEITNDVMSATTMLAQLSISTSDIKNIPIETNQSILSFAYKPGVLGVATKLTQKIKQNRKAKLTF